MRARTAKVAFACTLAIYVFLSGAVVTAYVGFASMELPEPPADGPPTAVEAPAIAEAPQIIWIRQFGTPADEGSLGIAVDPSGVYVAGGTAGVLPGQTSPGGTDAFLRKYDASGNEAWTRQFGTSEDNGARGVAIDGSGVYVAGSTYGALPGQTSAGSVDAYVRRYDLDGNEVWTRQFGGDMVDITPVDIAEGIAAGTDGSYVVGWTQGVLQGQTSAGRADAYVRKYDPDGNEMWTRQFGSTSTIDEAKWDYARAVAADASGVYVAGTGGPLVGQTSGGAFIRKYDLQGNELWTQQPGIPSGVGGVAVDASGVYMAGDVRGALPGQTSAGETDIYVRKYDSDGNELWTRQFGTSDWDFALQGGVAVDASGVYVAGRTAGVLPGQTSGGSNRNYDAFVRKYDSDGNELWTRQFGSSADESVGGGGVSVDAAGVYVASNTEGALPGQTSAGGSDAFVAKLAASTAPNVPSAPRSLTATSGDGQVTLSWQAPALDGGSPITGYRIYRGTSPGNLFPLTEVGNVLAYTDAGLTNGVTYYYQVSAVNAVGEGPPSSELAATPSGDNVPPILNVPSGPIVAEATGPSGATVEYAVTAEDDVDGSLTPVCSPASGSVFPLGTTTVTCTATDSSGNTASATFTVTVQDTTRPTLTVPTDITAEAASPAGAVVTYQVTATDLVDPSAVVSCSPSSGSTFGIGTTTVTCTATDSAGNTATASFEVTVTERVGPSGFDSWPIALAAVVVAIGVAAAAVVSFMRRKRKGRGPTGEKGRTR